MGLKLVDIIILIIIFIVAIAALIMIRRNKGKCAYCTHSENCPFKKVK